MTSYTSRLFGETEARILLDRGWSQGQIIHPNENMPILPDGRLFVICTQSCSVVSESLERDPYVEVAEAKPLQKLNRKINQALGKDVRKFHLPVQGATFEAVEVNVNKRCFVQRELLLVLDIPQYSVSVDDRRALAGWLARYYSRIDLPTELVNRLRKYSLVRLKEFLDGKSSDGVTSRHSRVRSVWIKYHPESELQDNEDYEVEILILGTKPVFVEEIDRGLMDIFGNLEFVRDGIRIALKTASTDATFVSDLDDWHRFSDWDHVSGMWESSALSKA